MFSLSLILYTLLGHPTNVFEFKTPEVVSEAPTIPNDQIETYTATVTAYTAIETCRDRCTMASGKQAYVGAAACPRDIPLGTWVDIQGIGIVVCEDRTAQRVDGRFDVFFGYAADDYARAIQFGKSQREITINHSL